MSKSSNSKNLLPNSTKPKGEENYTVQKKVIENIAITNRLKQYIYKKEKALKYMDEFNKKTNKIKLAVQQIWKAKNLSIKIIIKLNIKSTSVQMLAGCKLIYKI